MSSLLDASGRPVAPAADADQAEFYCWALICQRCKESVHPCPAFKLAASEMKAFATRSVPPHGWGCKCPRGLPTDPTPALVKLLNPPPAAAPPEPS